MKSVLHDGKSEARIDLAELTRFPHCYAVGSLAGLEGEVIVIDGAPWVTRSDGTTSVTTLSFPDDKAYATLLTAAYVPQWTSMTRDHAMSLEQLEHDLSSIALEHGGSAARGLPFLVEGTFEQLSYHVIRGACPVQTDPGGPGTEPFQTTAQRQRGMLVGFYVAGAGGRVTHHGRSTHTHVFLPGKEPSAGHVDDFLLAAGAVIRVPAVR